MRKLLMFGAVGGVVYALRRPITRFLTRATGTWVGTEA
jgi:hypothetical protein